MCNLCVNLHFFEKFFVSFFTKYGLREAGVFGIAPNLLTTH